MVDWDGGVTSQGTLLHSVPYPSCACTVVLYMAPVRRRSRKPFAGGYSADNASVSVFVSEEACTFVGSERENLPRW